MEYHHHHERTDCVPRGLFQPWGALCHPIVSLTRGREGEFARTRVGNSISEPVPVPSPEVSLLVLTYAGTTASNLIMSPAVVLSRDCKHQTSSTSKMSTLRTRPTQLWMKALVWHAFRVSSRMITMVLMDTGTGGGT